MNQLNKLATKVKKARGRDRSILYMKLRKGLGGVIANVRKSFSADILERIDFDSVVDFALLKSLRTYDEDKGRVDYHAHRWIREYVKREIIDCADIKIPHRIANWMYKISREDRDLLLDPDHKVGIMTKYSLSSGEYESLVIVVERWKMSIEYEDESIANSDIEIIDNHLASLDEDEAFIIRNLLNLPGTQGMGRMELAGFFKVKPEDIDRQELEILEKLRGNFV